MSLEFLITSLVVVLAPGSGALFTIAAGLSRGARAGIVAAFGCTLGIVPHMIAAISGAAALLHASAIAFESLKFAGVGYLLYLAWGTLRESGTLSVHRSAKPRSAARIIYSAILVNLFNPKLSIFFFAFLPQFVRVDDPAALAQMFELSAVFMAMTFLVFAAYGVFAAAMRRRVLSSPSVLGWLRRGFAAAFVGLGAKLAFAER